MGYACHRSAASQNSPRAMLAGARIHWSFLTPGVAGPLCSRPMRPATVVGLWLHGEQGADAAHDLETADGQGPLGPVAQHDLSPRLVRHLPRPRAPWGSGRPGSLLTLAPHRSGRAGSAASGSSTDGFATRRRVPAGPGSQAMATAIPKAYLASSAIRCRDVETGPNLGVLAVFPSTGATCRCPLPSTGSRGLNSPASAVL